MMNMPAAAMMRGRPRKKVRSAITERARISKVVATMSDQLKRPCSFSKTDAASSTRFCAVSAMPTIYWHKEKQGSPFRYSFKIVIGIYDLCSFPCHGIFFYRNIYTAMHYGA